MRKWLCLLLLPALLLGCTAPALAAEIAIDWAGVEWNTKVLSQFFSDSEIWKALIRWLWNEADLHQVFQVCSHGDGAMGYEFADICCVKFMADPSLFLTELAGEDWETQERILANVASGCLDRSVEARQLLSRFKEDPRLPGAPEEVNSLLLALIGLVEQYHGADFTTPDPDYVYVDWAGVDWEAFDWGKLDERFYRTYLREWYRNEADLAGKIRISFCCAHSQEAAYYQEQFFWAFSSEPGLYFQVLGEESPKIRDMLIPVLLLQLTDDYNIQRLEKGMKDLEFPAGTSKAGRELALRVAQMMENNYGLSVTIPQTGDPGIAAAAGLLLSMGGILLLRKKKIP